MSANGINVNTLQHKSSITGTERMMLISKTKAIPTKEVTVDEFISKVASDLPNPTFQTNTVENTDQTNLNLIEGENINISEDGSGNVTVDLEIAKSTVTQITAVTTAVEVNATAGVITTFAATTAAGSNFAA